ncbi:MAG: thiamine phosphate synthase [Aureispira sp.]
MKHNYQTHQNLPRLHYVSQGNTVAEHLSHIQRLCEAGCPWVQLRLKEVNQEQYEQAARQALAICRRYNTLLTINDNWEVARVIKADGIHVGKTDTPPQLVREACPEAIIGATANTWEDVEKLATTPIDYIGLGPLRFTTTKKKLSPPLGIEGYDFLLKKMKKKEIGIPVLAIGGIREEDVTNLRKVGLWGVAVSGLLTQSIEPQELINRILD